MRKFLLLAMCALVSGLAVGQIANTQIKMPAGDSIISMVSVSDVSGVQNSYLLVTTYDKNVFLGQLDNNTPQGLYNNFFDKFQLPSTHTGYFFNGAFVDYDGNIVAYGYCDSDYKGLIVIYNMNTNGTHATSIDYSVSPVSYTNILDGCCAKLTGNKKAYGFVTYDKFMRIPFRNENFLKIVKDFGSQYNTNSMSISFDDFNGKFVVSGTRQSGFLFGTFANSLTLNNTNNPFFFYSMPTNYISSEYTSKHVLSGNELYSDGIAYVVQDFRNTANMENFDGLWVMKINYLNNTVVGSMGYNFLHSKVLIHDVAHNFDNLFVLGHHNGNLPNTSPIYERRFLAQINLYDSTDFVVYHLKTVPHVDYPKYSHNSFLSNIVFNQYTYFVQAAGAYNGNGYFTECYDLNYNECDSLIDNALVNINYSVSSCPYVNGTTNSMWGINANDSFPWTNVLVYNSRYFWTVDECSSGLYYDYESMIADTKMRLSDKIEVPITKKSVSVDGEINVLEENSFVCSKFSGNCKYIVYDIQGRVVNEGTTQNGNTNYLNGLVPGLYLIRVTDSNNGSATKKIVVN
ncbi:MAG: T9SS type A sorting domain-containing protein [Bacteroidales bacterium]|nr:T9SS type A sorting domain-containing protein [Bacteroidales bacterium]